MQTTFTIDGYHGLDIPRVEIAGDIEVAVTVLWNFDEQWNFHGRTIGHDPAIERITFTVTGFPVQSMNTAYAEWLDGLMATHREFARAIKERARESYDRYVQDAAEGYAAERYEEILHSAPQDSEGPLAGGGR